VRGGQYQTLCCERYSLDELAAYAAVGRRRCDTGQAAVATVRADHTCTFVAAKIGFLAAAAGDFLGQLHVVSIGIPGRLINEVLASR